MDKSSLEIFKRRFQDYAGSFALPDPEGMRCIELKIEHTAKVCEIIVRIAAESGFSPDRVLLSEAVALFHDIGRFPQFARWRTFRDSVSENHGELGSRILAEDGLIGECSGREQELIITAVKYHNAFGLPTLKDPEALEMIRLIRDADKLDIWRVAIGYYEGDEKNRGVEVILEFPETPGYSEEILSCVTEKKMASLADVKNVNDFKLLQLAWVYDLNFAASFRMLLERDYIGRLAAVLPDTEGIKKAARAVREFAEGKAG